MLSAISYIHLKNTFHWDIKPENILMENDRIYLCDFGFTAFFGNDEQWISMCGTWDYLAPEIAMKKP